MPLTAVRWPPGTSSLLVLCALAGCASSVHEPLATESIGAGGLTLAQAKVLLIAVLEQEGFKPNAPGAFIDDDFRGHPIPGYFLLSFGIDDPEAGATEYGGWYAMSPTTGDLWEINQCKRFSSPQLRRVQARIGAATRQPLDDEQEARRRIGCGP
jgi:hypothetical protein